jgi:hypothetical protein
MPTLMIEYRDDAERLALEQAIAYVAQLRQTALTAAEGTVLAVCEQIALRDGRALLRSTLAAAVESRVALAEQKGGTPASVPKRTPDAPRVGTHARS